MKHIGCILLAVLLCLLSVLAAAESVPANPMAQPGYGVIATVAPAPPSTENPVPVIVQTRQPTAVPTQTPAAVPTQAPTAVPTQESTAIPTQTPAAVPTVTEMNAPAIPSDDYIMDDILSEEIVALLDEEAKEYLTGSGEVIETIDGIRNILLVGVDARPGETKSRSDTMVILTVDGNKNEIRLTSLMRDMYVSLPGRSNNRINAAWVYGGPELLIAAIEENFGLKIEDYVAVDLRVMIDIVDRLGGLTLTVETKKQLNAINGVIDAFNYQFREKTNDGLLKQTASRCRHTRATARAKAMYSALRVRERF